ncbi:MAG: hypothetical protein G01um101419_646 [Parcubacteria group bacterium Gr01-1014_19]|nr:MAG: hypothetical protein G01um101419_646 [Parcubacteria group bacterium Gr01-1014_19]
MSKDERKPTDLSPEEKKLADKILADAEKEIATKIEAEREKKRDGISERITERAKDNVLISIEKIQTRMRAEVENKKLESLEQMSGHPNVLPKHVVWMMDTLFGELPLSTEITKKVRRYPELTRVLNTQYDEARRNQNAEKVKERERNRQDKLQKDREEEARREQSVRDEMDYMRSNNGHSRGCSCGDCRVNNDITR